MEYVGNEPVEVETDAESLIAVSRVQHEQAASPFAWTRARPRLALAALMAVLLLTAAVVVKAPPHFGEPRGPGLEAGQAHSAAAAVSAAAHDLAAMVTVQGHDEAFGAGASAVAAFKSDKAAAQGALAQGRGFEPQAFVTLGENKTLVLLDHGKSKAADPEALVTLDSEEKANPEALVTLDSEEKVNTQALVTLDSETQASQARPQVRVVV